MELEPPLELLALPEHTEADYQDQVLPTELDQEQLEHMELVELLELMEVDYQDQDQVSPTELEPPLELLALLEPLELTEADYQVEHQAAMELLTEQPVETLEAQVELDTLLLATLQAASVEPPLEQLEPPLELLELLEQVE